MTYSSGFSVFAPFYLIQVLAPVFTYEVAKKMNACISFCSKTSIAFYTFGVVHLLLRLVVRLLISTF